MLGGEFVTVDYQEEGTGVGGIPEIGEIHQNWTKIDSLRGAQTYPDANAALMDMLSGPKEMPEEEEAPAGRALVGRRQGRQDVEAAAQGVARVR